MNDHDQLQQFKEFVWENLVSDEWKELRNLAVALYEIKLSAPSRAQWSKQVEVLAQARLMAKHNPDDPYLGSLQFIRLRLCQQKMAALLPYVDEKWWAKYLDACHLISGFDNKFR